jgi:hypothetical protein
MLRRRRNGQVLLATRSTGAHIEPRMPRSRVDLAALTSPGDAGYVTEHLHVTLLAASDGVAIREVRCSCPQSR